MKKNCERKQIVCLCWIGCVRWNDRYWYTKRTRILYLNNTKRHCVVATMGINDTEQQGLRITWVSYTTSQTQRKTRRVQGWQRLIDFKWKSVATTSTANGTQNVKQMSFNLYRRLLFHQISGRPRLWPRCKILFFEASLVLMSMTRVRNESFSQITVIHLSVSRLLQSECSVGGWGVCWKAFSRLAQACGV